MKKIVNLNCENILKIYDIKNIEQNFYIIMEYCELGKKLIFKLRKFER